MTDQMPNNKSMAYLVSQYPMLSMIFIVREVLQLRQLGFNIDVASVSAADRPPENLEETELAEYNRTFYVKPQGIKSALTAHWKTLITRPKSYFLGWKTVLKLSGSNLKSLIFNSIYLTEALIVGNWMTDKGQQHVHTHLGNQAATLGIYIKQVFDYGFSITIHGPDEFYNAPGQYLTEKVITADFICAISHFARSQLMKLSAYEHWHKIEVSRLGVDPDIFKPKPFNPSPEVYEIICVGRLASAKGQHILVEAIKQLLERQCSVRLRLVGDGEHRKSLETQVSELSLQQAVIFEGAVNQDRIRDLYAQADIFSIPSFAEGIPVVLMEAMAMEIPCVTTRITGIPELIRNEVDGLLVPPSDASALADAIQRLIKDPGLRERLGKQGRQQVIENYNLAKNVDHLASIFERRLA